MLITREFLSCGVEKMFVKKKPIKEFVKEKQRGVSLKALEKMVKLLDGQTEELLKKSLKQATYHGRKTVSSQDVEEAGQKEQFEFENSKLY